MAEVQRRLQRLGAVATGYCSSSLESSTALAEVFDGSHGDLIACSGEDGSVDFVI
jgi:hypothetical protein